MGNALLAEQNIFGGVKYLAGLLKQYGGNVALATAAYNAGAGAVQNMGASPLCRNTRLRRAGATAAPALQRHAERQGL